MVAYTSEREAMKDGTIEAMSGALQLPAHKSNTALDRSTSTSAPSLRHHILLHRHVTQAVKDLIRDHPRVFWDPENGRKLTRGHAKQWFEKGEL